MKLLSSISYFAISAVVGLSLLSCTKEVIKETIVQKDSIIIKRDSIIIRKDSIIIKQDVPKLFKKKWLFLSHEYESYSGTVLISKKFENFISSGFYNEFKANGTYDFFTQVGTTLGVWELIGDNYYVLDKNTVNERYYYIISISETSLINKGPFNKNNQLLTNYLATAYFKSPI